MKRKKRVILCVCIAVLVAILFNVAVALIPSKFRWMDVTEHKIYTVSKETREYLSKIDEPMTLHLVHLDGGDAELEYYLERFCQYTSHLTLEKSNVEEAEEILARAGISAENLSEDTLILDGEKRTAMLNYSDLFYYATENQTLNGMGLYEMSVSEYRYYVNLYSQDSQNAEYLSYLLNDSHLYFKGEAALLSMIEYVSAEIIPTHYVLTGHGETNLAPSLFAQIAFSFGGGYQLLDLSEEETIPKDAASVLLFAPSEDYSAEQIESLKSYVDGGGLLTVVTGSEQLSFPNLMSLLSSYGLSADASEVTEEVTVLDESEQEEPTKEISEVVDAFVNTDHDAMASPDLADALPAVWGGNAISFDGSMDHKALLTTSSEAMLGKDPSTKGEKVLAATAENAQGAKLVWFTGAESFCVPLSEMTENSPAIYNAYCLYRVRDWTNLVVESTLSLPEATIYDASYLQMTSGGAIFLMVFGVLFVPAGIAVWGIVVHYRRKKA